jgi:hypothetical protein
MSPTSSLGFSIEEFRSYSSFAGVAKETCRNDRMLSFCLGSNSTGKEDSPRPARRRILPQTGDRCGPGTVGLRATSRWLYRIVPDTWKIARPTSTSVYSSRNTSRCSLQDSRPGWIRYFLSCRALASLQHAGLSRRSPVCRPLGI